MRIRHFIAALMILLSLSAQARTVLACGMPSGTPLTACCCPGDGQNQSPAAATVNHCCDQVAPADAPLAHAGLLSAKRQVSVSFSDSPAVAMVQVRLLQSSLVGGGGRRSSPRGGGADRRRIRPLYLRTARLRL